MKKFLSITLAMLAGISIFTSCKNDDIEISTATTFNIKVDEVISFPFELEDGELSVISSNDKIRTRVFLYDANGALAGQGVEYLNNYDAKAKFEILVPKGTYTAIAITDVVEITNSKISFQFWEFNDSTRLSSARLKDAGFIGGTRKILGLDKKRITISGDEEYSFAPQPAGALILCYISNWNAYSNYVTYGWETNRSIDYCTFDQEGNYSPSVEASSDFDWYLSKCTVDSQYSGWYGYYFVFPMRNAQFRMYCKDKSNKQYYFGSSTTTISSIQAGEEYLFFASLKDTDNGGKDYFEYDDFENTRATFSKFNVRSLNHFSQQEQNDIRLKDIFEEEEL